MVLPLSRTININTNPTVPPSAERNFGNGLVLRAPATSTVPATIRRDRAIRIYSDFNSFSADFEATDDVYGAVQRWFGQDPRPESIAVAGYFPSGYNGQVYGSAVTPTRAAVQAVTTFTFLNKAITVDLASATTVAAVATALQTGINNDPDLDGVTVTPATGGTLPASGDGSFQLTIEIPLAEATDANLSYAKPFVTGAGATTLGLDVSGEMNVTPVRTETISQALSRIDVEYSNWYLFALTSALEATADNVTATAVWTATNTKAYFPTITGSAPLSAGASVDKTLNAGNYTSVVGTWSQTADYKGLAIAARQSSVDYLNGRVINLSKQRLTGVTADDIVEAQADRLDASNTNYYAEIQGGRQAYETGKNYNGTFADQEFFIDFLEDRVTNQVYDLLQRANFVQNTASGRALISNVIRAACELGVSNGALAGGRVKADAAADIRSRVGAFDGILPRGYKVYARIPTEAQQLAREAIFDVWVRFANPVNTIRINLNF